MEQVLHGPQSRDFPPRAHGSVSAKYRMNEFEAAVLLAQLAASGNVGLRRNENAALPDVEAQGCPGVVPRSSMKAPPAARFTLYSMSYKKEQFNNVSRGLFLKAVAAEGVGLSPYIERGLHRSPGRSHREGQDLSKGLFSRRLEQFREG